MGGQRGLGTNIETSRQTEQWRLPCLSSHPPLSHNQLTDWNGVFTVPPPEFDGDKSNIVVLCCDVM